MEVSVELGGMFGGKTTALHAKAKRHLLAGDSVLFLVPEIDNRYSLTRSVSHDGSGIRTTRIGKTHLLSELPPAPFDITDTDVVCIDEFQFLEGVVEFITLMRAVKRTKPFYLYLAGLASDFNGNPWKNVTDVCPAHVTAITLHAGICIVCRGLAYCSRKIAGNRGELVDVGGADKYVPTCHLHLKEPAEIPQDLLDRRKIALEQIKKISN
jgi:thymidine kinase